MAVISHTSQRSVIDTADVARRHIAMRVTLLLALDDAQLMSSAVTWCDDVSKHTV